MLSKKLRATAPAVFVPYRSRLRWRALSSPWAAPSESASGAGTPGGTCRTANYPVCDDSAFSRRISAEPVLVDEDVEQAPVPVALPLWQPTLRKRIAEAWHSRHLLRGMMLSSVQTFQGRIMGRFWFLLRPLWQVFGMALIFGGIFHAKAPNGIPYLLYVVFSFQAFTLFRITIMYETVSPKQIKVARNLRIPLLLVPLAILGRVFARLSVYWLIAACILLYYWIAKGHLYLQLNARLLVGVAGVALCLIFGIAIGLFTMVLYARARDVKYLLRFFLPVWLFLTPCTTRPISCRRGRRPSRRSIR